jgi:hypothetical protein
VNPLIGAMAANVSGYRAAMYQVPEPLRLGPDQQNGGSSFHGEPVNVTGPVSRDDRRY